MFTKKLSHSSDVTYIFGYGSLMCQESAHKTGKLDVIARDVTLHGYQRAFDAPGKTCRYLNIRKNKDYHVVGAIIAVPDREMPALLAREWSYELINVSKELDGFQRPTHAFIAPPVTDGELCISLRYIATCLNGVAPEKRREWLTQSIIEHPIHDDAGVTRVTATATGHQTNHLATYQLIKELGYAVV